ncbi:MAG: hypothetical protein JWQ12_1106 [Glaciihabitans sp.]|nr:hypothetical protein [Glaciihabitans sp.]
MLIAVQVQVSMPWQCDEEPIPRHKVGHKSDPMQALDVNGYLTIYWFDGHAAPHPAPAWSRSHSNFVEPVPQTAHSRYAVHRTPH